LDGHAKLRGQLLQVRGVDIAESCYFQTVLYVVPRLSLNPKVTSAFGIE